MAGASGLAQAAAKYLGTTPQQAEELFQRQDADLDALDRLNRLTAETDGAFFRNGEATVNVTSARAAGLARQLGPTPRYAVRGVRALDALGTRVAQLAGDTRLARDVAAQQLVVYLPATAAKKRVIMAAGHCVEDVNTVRNEDLGQAFLGWRIAGAYFTGFRSSDVGLIELSALADSYTNINTHVGTKVVQGRHSPVTGMTICKSGATTGWDLW